MTERWVKEGTAFDVHWYRRPLVLTPLITAGFIIEHLVEPLPQPEMRNSHPDVWAKLTSEPWFLAVSAVRAETERRG